MLDSNVHIAEEEWIVLCANLDFAHLVLLLAHHLVSLEQRCVFVCIEASLEILAHKNFDERSATFRTDAWSGANHDLVQDLTNWLCYQFLVQLGVVVDVSKLRRLRNSDSRPEPLVAVV